MNPSLTTRASEAGALAYLRARGLAHKLQDPVPVLFHNPRHAEALRRLRDQRAELTERRSRRLAAWAIPFPLLSFFR